ncbi:hypothetical protein BACPEC_02494 [[Bacteroides] pectinophilus ATCC 43243]|uniref:Uncharacterized protein n=1 Tax=[Bacteroides] pectinophilus ATCC 43243 TaxID=483218 RepID=B7AUU6_9FIRM|nr:hypothetical protein BACPEC_02494 [[Bacteroides] pectinophilus ATCC 43243]
MNTIADELGSHNAFASDIDMLKILPTDIFLILPAATEDTDTPKP